MKIAIISYSAENHRQGKEILYGAMSLGTLVIPPTFPLTIYTLSYFEIRCDVTRSGLHALLQMTLKHAFCSGPMYYAHVLR